MSREDVPDLLDQWWFYDWKEQKSQWNRRIDGLLRCVRMCCRGGQVDDHSRVANVDMRLQQVRHVFLQGDACRCLAEVRRYCLGKLRRVAFFIGRPSLVDQGAGQ